MRRKLYTRVTNRLIRMNTPRLSVRDNYVAAGHKFKMVDVSEHRPGRVEIIFFDGKRAYTKRYKNLKAICEIKEFLR